MGDAHPTPSDCSRIRERPVDERSGEFDVFICYNSNNVAEVAGIVRELKRLGIRAWFDRELLRPGDQITHDLNDVLSRMRCAMMFFGDQGLGDYQGLELGGLISRLAQRNPSLPTESSTASRHWTPLPHDSRFSCCQFATGRPS